MPIEHVPRLCQLVSASRGSGERVRLQWPFCCFFGAPTRPRGGHVALKRVFKALEYSFPSRTWGWAVVSVEKMMCQNI